VPDQLVNVRYMIDDVEDAVDFYTTHFGLTIRSNFAPGSPNVVRGNLRLLLSGPTSSSGRPMPDGRTPKPGGWNRIHLIVDAIATEVERLRAAGLTFDHAGVDDGDAGEGRGQAHDEPDDPGACSAGRLDAGEILAAREDARSGAHSSGARGWCATAAALRRRRRWRTCRWRAARRAAPGAGCRPAPVRARRSRQPAVQPGLCRPVWHGGARPTTRRHRSCAVSICLAPPTVCNRLD
jgi:catechol 2,3-dioxygenase-like lactoylglutathione lyase family enzyme